MPPSEYPTFTACKLRFLLTVREAYEITYSATGVGMKPIYFRGLALEKGTYSIPLEPSQHCGASWMGLTHSSPEHPDTSETSSSDCPARILGEMKWKITMTEASNITFEATPAPCLGLKPVYCESFSMHAVTIEVRLKPVRPNRCTCGHVLLPSPHHCFPDHFDIIKGRVSWTFTAEEPGRKEWRASESQCPNVSLPDVDVDVSGAGTYEFGVENVRPHSSAADDSVRERIPESPFNELGSTACEAPAGNRKSNSGERDFPSNGPNSEGGEIIPMESPVPVLGEFAGDLVQSDVKPLHSRKRAMVGFVKGAEGVAKKKARSDGSTTQDGQ
jgi:hypothetical protein